MVQATGHRGADATRDVRGHGELLPTESLRDQRHGLAGEVLHDDEVALLVVSDIENLDHVGMAHGGRQSSFIEEHLDEALALAQMRKDALDHHGLLEAANALLDGQVHLCHSTAADFMAVLVAAHDC